MAKKDTKLDTNWMKVQISCGNIERMFVRLMLNSKFVMLMLMLIQTRAKSVITVCESETKVKPYVHK